MNKNINIDNKILNELIKVCNKVFKNINILVLIFTIYISILIIKNLNIMYFVITFFKILSPLFIGILIAWLLRPIVNFLERKGINRLLALIMVYILIGLIFYISFMTFIPRFLKELTVFIKILPNMLDTLFGKVKIFNNFDYKFEMTSILNKFIKTTGKEIPVTFINVVKGFSSLIVGFIIGFYLLISNNIITINANIKRETFELIMKINGILRNYVKATFLSSLIVFVLSSVVFYIIGLENALLFGFICGITNIIPFIGPYIGAIIPILVAFTKDISFGIIVLVIILVIQTVEGNIINPVIMSKRIKIHPIISIVSFLVFGYFFGIIGMVFAVPLIASLKELYFYSIKMYNNYKKNLSK